MKIPKWIGCCCSKKWRRKSLIQSGRSMIEMLGVLAIVGLLSIGGLSMYQRAMLAHHTNQLIEDVQFAGFIVLDEYLDRLTLEETSLAGRFEQQTPYNFTATLENETKNTFVILVDGVPFNICKETLERKPQWAEEIIANGEENTCHEEPNLITFFFDSEAGGLSDFCTKDSDCGDCSECKNNRCRYGIKNTSTELCYFCDVSTKLIAHVNKEACGRCKNRMSSGGSCVIPLSELDESARDGNWWSNVEKDVCERFPNQYSISDGGHCFYCKGTFDRTTGTCNTTTNCNVIVQGAKTIFGMDETTCVLCGGSFSLQDMEDGGKVSVCYRESGWNG